MEAAAIFLPLVGALIAGFFGRQIGDRASQVVTCLGVGSAAVLSIPLFFDVAVNGNALVDERPRPALLPSRYANP